MRVEPHRCPDVGNGLRRSPAGGECRAHVGIAERVAGIDRDRLLQFVERLVGLEVDQQDEGCNLVRPNRRCLRACSVPLCPLASLDL